MMCIPTCSHSKTCSHPWIPVLRRHRQGISVCTRPDKHKPMNTWMHTHTHVHIRTHTYTQKNEWLLASTVRKVVYCPLATHDITVITNKLYGSHVLSYKQMPYRYNIELLLHIQVKILLVLFIDTGTPLDLSTSPMLLS